MKKLLSLCFCLLTFIPLMGQSSNYPQTATTYPDEGRFEIILSPITMRDTYLLDRMTGDTWRMVSTYFGNDWGAIHKNQHPNDVVPDGYDGAVYQIYVSGISAKGTYLLNTLTGATWVMYQDSDTEELFWGVLGSDLE